MVGGGWVVLIDRTGKNGQERALIRQGPAGTGKNGPERAITGQGSHMQNGPERARTGRKA